jgi:hypothetical protein
MKTINGVASYLETHFAINYALIRDLDDNGTTAYKIKQKEGIEGVKQLAETLTDQFELENQDVVWPNLTKLSTAVTKFLKRKPEPKTETIIEEPFKDEPLETE